jgi:hypothetical protein
MLAPKHTRPNTTWPSPFPQGNRLKIVLFFKLFIVVCNLKINQFLKINQ